MNDLTRRAPWLWRALLLLALALALLPTTDLLRLAGSLDAADGMVEIVDELPPESLVLVGFDPDLGTYAEIRPTVRTLLADLLEHDARLVFVSLTPEGRALAIAERARLLASDVAPERLLDIGFIPGAEAAIVSLARAIGRQRRRIGGRAAGSSRSRSGWSSAATIWDREAGSSSSNRASLGWSSSPIAPTVLLPELTPYLESGQLRALLATPRDGAAYRASVTPTPLGEFEGPAPLGGARRGAGCGGRAGHRGRLASRRRAPIVSWA